MTTNWPNNTLHTAPNTALNEAPSSLPVKLGPAQTILAIDYGVKRIGLAIGNTQIRLAHPLKTMHSQKIEVTLRLIAQLVKEWEVHFFVVGLPTHPDGTAHSMTKKSQRFGQQLHSALQLPVQWVDERYTSAVVDNPRGDIDRQAAVLILEQYFQENPL